MTYSQQVMMDLLKQELAALREQQKETAKAQYFEIERLRQVLKRIADAPAWGAPDRWETTPAEVRQLARDALEAKP